MARAVSSRFGVIHEWSRLKGRTQPNKMLVIMRGHLEALALLAFASLTDVFRIRDYVIDIKTLFFTVEAIDPDQSLFVFSLRLAMKTTTHHEVQNAHKISSTNSESRITNSIFQVGEYCRLNEYC